MVREPPRADRASILLVEDDPDLRSTVGRFLRGHGHPVDEVGDAGRALERWEASRPDLVLLDLGLPDLDGVSVVRHIRREASTPIVVISARDRETDKVEALDAGADDYVTKPFGMGELRARVDAVLRRAAGPRADAEGAVTVGDLRLDVATHQVTVAGRPIHLTPREFEVLKVLVTHAGRLVTHGRLLRAVWGTAYSDESHYVHVHVSQIRRKIAAADPEGRLRTLIVAEPGVGYRIAAGGTGSGGASTANLERSLSDRDA
jgi:two-component system KDP operon response regulator KdpE